MGYPGDLYGTGRNQSCGRKDRDKSAGAVWTWLRNLCLPPSDGKASD